MFQVNPMKNQALFLRKIKVKKNKMLFAAIFVWRLRVNWIATYIPRFFPDFFFRFPYLFFFFTDPKV